MQKIAIFASGTGTNASKIIEHFASNEEVEIALILSNRPKAYVLKVAENNNIPAKVINRSEFYDSNDIVEELENSEIDFIVLAGFLWLIPSSLINSYPNKIINIHPALLPKYGGKGMYGRFVHEAVFNAKETESGITIHFVNEEYDEGKIVFQAHCLIDPSDGPKEIGKKIQELEHKYYPIIVEKLLRRISIN